MIVSRLDWEAKHDHNKMMTHKQQATIKMRRQKVKLKLGDISIGPQIQRSRRKMGPKKRRRRCRSRGGTFEERWAEHKHELVHLREDQKAKLTLNNQTESPKFISSKLNFVISRRCLLMISTWLISLVLSCHMMPASSPSFKGFNRAQSSSSDQLYRDAKFHEQPTLRDFKLEELIERLMFEAEVPLERRTGQVHQVTSQIRASQHLRELLARPRHILTSFVPQILSKQLVLRRPKHHHLRSLHPVAKLNMNQASLDPLRFQILPAGTYRVQHLNGLGRPQLMMQQRNLNQTRNWQAFDGRRAQPLGLRTDFKQQYHETRPVFPVVRPESVPLPHDRRPVLTSVANLDLESTEKDNENNLDYQESAIKDQQAGIQTSEAERGLNQMDQLIKKEFETRMNLNELASAFSSASSNSNVTREQRSPTHSIDASATTMQPEELALERPPHQDSKGDGVSSVFRAWPQRDAVMEEDEHHHQDQLPADSAATNLLATTSASGPPPPGQWRPTDFPPPALLAPPMSHGANARHSHNSLSYEQTADIVLGRVATSSSSSSSSLAPSGATNGRLEIREPPWPSRAPSLKAGGALPLSAANKAASAFVPSALETILQLRLNQAAGTNTNAVRGPPSLQKTTQVDVAHKSHDQPHILTAEQSNGDDAEQQVSLLNGKPTLPIHLRQQSEHLIGSRQISAVGQPHSQMTTDNGENDDAQLHRQRDRLARQQRLFATANRQVLSHHHNWPAQASTEPWPGQASDVMLAQVERPPPPPRPQTSPLTNGDFGETLRRLRETKEHIRKLQAELNATQPIMSLDASETNGTQTLTTSRQLNEGGHDLAQARPKSTPVTFSELDGNWFRTWSAPFNRSGSTFVPAQMVKAQQSMNMPLGLYHNGPLTTPARLVASALGRAVQQTVGGAGSQTTTSLPISSNNKLPLTIVRPSSAPILLSSTITVASRSELPATTLAPFQAANETPQSLRVRSPLDNQKDDQGAESKSLVEGRHQDVNNNGRPLTEGQRQQLDKIGGGETASTLTSIVQTTSSRYKLPKPAVDLQDHQQVNSARSEQEPFSHSNGVAAGIGGQRQMKQHRFQATTTPQKDVAPTDAQNDKRLSPAFHQLATESPIVILEPILNSASSSTLATSNGHHYHHSSSSPGSSSGSSATTTTTTRKPIAWTRDGSLASGPKRVPITPETTTVMMKESGPDSRQRAHTNQTTHAFDVSDAMTMNTHNKQPAGDGFLARLFNDFIEILKLTPFRTAGTSSTQATDLDVRSPGGSQANKTTNRQPTSDQPHQVARSLDSSRGVGGALGSIGSRGSKLTTEKLARTIIVLVSSLALVSLLMVLTFARLQRARRSRRQNFTDPQQHHQQVVTDSQTNNNNDSCPSGNEQEDTSSLFMVLDSSNQITSEGNQLRQHAPTCSVLGDWCRFGPMQLLARSQSQQQKQNANKLILDGTMRNVSMLSKHHHHQASSGPRQACGQIASPVINRSCCHCVSCSESWLFREQHLLGVNHEGPLCSSGFYHPAPRGKLPFGAASSVNNMLQRHSSMAKDLRANSMMMGRHHQQDSKTSRPDASNKSNCSQRAPIGGTRLRMMSAIDENTPGCNGQSSAASGDEWTQAKLMHLEDQNTALAGTTTEDDQDGEQAHHHHHSNNHSHHRPSCIECEQSCRVSLAAAVQPICCLECNNHEHPLACREDDLLAVPADGQHQVATDRLHHANPNATLIKAPNRHQHRFEHQQQQQQQQIAVTKNGGN